MTAGHAPPFRRIGIAGLGLIGGSIAHDLRARWPDTHLIGVDEPEVLEAARAAGIIDEGRRSAQALIEADLVVLATPVPAIIDVIGELASAGVAGLVTDVGSTKRHILAAAAQAGLARFVGGHPMAGSQRGGLAQSRTGLFEGRTWLVVPPATASDDDRRAIDAFARGLGAVPVAIDALTHDRLVAHVSHLPQLLAVALMNTAAEGCGEIGLDYAGRGFEDLTRLARSPADLWQGIVATNRDCIAQAVRDLIANLEPLADADPRTLDAAFARAASHARR